LLIAAATLVTGAACGAVTPYAAIVNGDRVSQRDLDRELKALRGNKKFTEGLQAQGVSIQGTARGTFDMAFVSRVLTRQIFFTLIHQLVEKRHIKITDAQLREAEREAQVQFGDAETLKAFPSSYVKKAVRTTAEIAALQGSLGKDEATPAKIREYYEAHRSEFETTCVSHILVDDEAKAKDIKAQIDKGGDFAELAKKESKDNGGGSGGSAAQGGALGCYTQAQSANFVPEFTAGYKDLPVGKVSDPVKSQFGYHIIKVTERKSQSLEDATASIRGQLTQGSQEQFNTLITSTATKAKVRVNPRYGHFDRSQLSVIPPDAPPAAGTPTTVGLPFETPGG
jgi:parvulin-like peptidyl-prolyl isomerase